MLKFSLCSLFNTLWIWVFSVDFMDATGAAHHNPALNSPPTCNR
jgi:hypothetical protein